MENVYPTVTAFRDSELALREQYGNARLRPKSFNARSVVVLWPVAKGRAATVGSGWTTILRVSSSGFHATEHPPFAKWD
jgi:hypothetical protein